MKQVYRNLFVGNDEDFEKVASKSDWRIIRACKEGGGGHRQTLGYEQKAAPKGPNYLFARKGPILALNLIDIDDPSYISDEIVDEAIKFIRENISEHPVLIACNQGRSRSPSLALLYLYSEGKLPAQYPQALRTFRKLYPNYDPSTGFHIYLRRRLSQMRQSNGRNA